ncbi:MAG TPA: hypothetical protein VLJ68_07890 [Chitinophagaceae bacterium]|nr:hypothetical protein [Chitinophagaceae bacterium]
MNKIFLPIISSLLFITACSNNKGKQPAPVDKNYEYLISMEGIGPVKLEMSQEELEKLLNKKIPLTNPTDTVSGSWQDTATVKYKDIDLKIHFQRNYVKGDSFYMYVIGVETSSPLGKTSSGLSLGADRSTIIDTYENNLILIWPDYLQEDTSSDKKRYLIDVRDEKQNSREISFSVVNKKVVSIKAGIHFSDSE